MSPNYSYLRRLLRGDIIFDEHTIPSPPHYYGDTVRAFFIFGAIVMLLSSPFLIHRIPIPSYGVIFLVVIVGFFAGITNPQQLASAVLDVVVSLTAFSVFEYYAIASYMKNSWTDGFLWINELLAIIFFIAFYYAVKTVRGFFVERGLVGWGNRKG